MQTHQASISKELKVTPAQAWEVIGAVGGVDRWFSSVITSCRVEDGKRFCQTADGIQLEEQILEVDHDNRTFRFGIPRQELLPVDDLVETMSVRSSDSGNAIVDWSASFSATSENASAATEALQNLWHMGLSEMEQFIHQNGTQ